MRRRQGFTLVELLVAMALTMFIMVILSEAFVAGLDTFSGLKAIGDMEENLRAGTTALRADLGADHFEGKRRVSDTDLYSNRPTSGFFRIYQGAAAPPAINEGADGDGIQSFRSNGFTPVVGGPTYGCFLLHMSVKRRGNGREAFFAASVPAGSPLLTAGTTFFDQSADARVQDTLNTYNSQWAEVAYFLVRTGSTTEPAVATSALGTPLYALYRVQRVVVADNSRVNYTNTVPIAAAAQYAQMSCTQGATNLYFNSPGDLTDPTKRAFNPASPTGQGATLLMTNVVSFHVRVLPSAAPPSTQSRRTYAADFVDVSFDSATSSTAVVGTTTFISAVAVSLRIWDQKTQQTRQVTVTQDM